MTGKDKGLTGSHPPKCWDLFSLDKSRKKTIAATVILRNIIEFVATKCRILRLKYTKFDLGWGSAGGAHSAPPDPVAGFEGSYF